MGSSINLPKSLSSNSEPQLTGKTGHPLTQLLLTVSQIVQLCTHVLGVDHVLGVERNFNMFVSKDGEVVQRGSGKSHWPFRGWMEATGCCGTLRCQSEYHIQAAAPIQGCTWREMIVRIGQGVGNHVISTYTYHHIQSGSLNSPGDFEESSHHCTQPTDALSRTSWQAGVCTDHQEPATCFPVEIPESCPETSPNSWSNNWVHWWPVLPVSSVVAHYWHR